MSKKEERNLYDKQTIQVFFSINTGFIIILWYGNYHISFMATATHKIVIVLPLDENNPVFIENT
jgi:hypothetical protein